MDASLLMRAAHFAAHAHRDQRRKSAAAHPYINHPLDVAALLSTVGGVTDPATLAAALLHDVVEDTEATLSDLTRHFGSVISGIVAECSDDKGLSKEQRKEAQVRHARSASRETRLVKLADKLSNLRDLLVSAPLGWSAARVREYFAWSARVVDELRGTSAPLEGALDAVFAQHCAAEAAASGASSSTSSTSSASPPSSSSGAIPPPVRNSSSLDDLYADCAPPPELPALERTLAAFLASHRAAGRPVALVTSGGTLVPLEARMVRFLDNFSTGLRGASLAEGLLAAGYAVCFLHRAGSRRPLLHSLLQALAAGMDSQRSVDVEGLGVEWGQGVQARQGGGAGGGGCGSGAEVEGGGIALGHVPPASTAPTSQQQPHLLEVPFTSVQDYLFKLRAAAQACQASCLLPSPPGFSQSECGMHGCCMCAVCVCV
jgi:guanosine-3',5'-bis(diphosphate) 3'-pyrophosphohydrolase